jgi:hypothetical protein
MSQPYKSKQQIWENKATIRTIPRRLLNKMDIEKGKYYFPISRKMICVQEKVKSLSKEQFDKILILSAYKYMGDIASIEMNIVASTTNNLIYNRYDIPLELPFSCKQDLLTIIIDEAYHAYVANDFIVQVEEITGVKQIVPFYHSTLEYAVDATKQRLDSRYHDIFSVMAVCIGENSLTKDLVNISREETVNNAFHQVNSDHMRDEGRHCGIFAYVLERLWASLSSQQKSAIAEVLPYFLKEYLNPRFEIDYDKKILQEVGFQSDDIEMIIKDAYQLSMNEETIDKNPVMQHVLTVFRVTGIVDDAAVKKAFSENNIVL